MSTASNKARWALAAKKELVGRFITGVRYLSKKETEDLGWYSSSLVIELSASGGPKGAKPVALFASQDDEGNDAGALFTTLPDLPTIPVI